MSQQHSDEESEYRAMPLSLLPLAEWVAFSKFEANQKKSKKKPTKTQ
jgi:hypothetical protein